MSHSKVSRGLKAFRRLRKPANAVVALAVAAVVTVWGEALPAHASCGNAVACENQQTAGVQDLTDGAGNLATYTSAYGDIQGFATTQSVLNVIGDDFFTAGVPLNGALGALEYVNPGISGLTGTKNFTADVIALQGSTMQVLTGQTVAGGVPEPAAWAMMLVGFGGLGAVLRRRRAQPMAGLTRA